jgi:hypothetical protein
MDKHRNIRSFAHFSDVDLLLAELSKTLSVDCVFEVEMGKMGFQGDAFDHQILSSRLGNGVIEAA